MDGMRATQGVGTYVLARRCGANAYKEEAEGRNKVRAREEAAWVGERCEPGKARQKAGAWKG